MNEEVKETFITVVTEVKRWAEILVKTMYHVLESLKKEEE